MTHIASSSLCPALQPLALCLALSAAFPASALAQSTAEPVLEPVIVTASRFASDPAFQPIGASVITAAQIHDAGIGNVNEALRKLGGVYGRQSLAGTSDYSLDLRGFGSNGNQNLVVLVDGIRLSENELTTALLSSIPIESVERIEIVRGGSSVLYGEGATGGTIQVITKRPVRNALRGSVVAEVGTFGHREVRTSVAKDWDGFSLDGNLSTQRADNYRANNAVQQDNFSGGAQWASNEGRIGFRLDLARQDSRLAGSLTLAQFESDPRQTRTPNNFASIDSDRYTLFAERRFGAFEVAAELSRRDKTAKASYSNSPSTYDSRVEQFSPRVRHLSVSGDVSNELVVGIDLSRWSRLTTASFSRADASQNAKAIYARDEIRFGKTRLAFGARHEVFDKTSVDPAPFTNSTYSTSQSLNAWDAQASYELSPKASVFAKAGQSYRIANVDENGSTPVANRPLAPQTSHDLELGATIGDAAQKGSVKVFQHRLRNEIFYDPTAGAFGANVNLDPTRREGIEVEASARVASAFTLSGRWQHVRATFTEGPNSGREMVLVPRNTVSMRLNWLPGNGQTANLGLQWVDTQRYGGDFSNTCTSRIPAFTTLDGRYAKRFDKWEVAIAGTNLTNKDYFSQAFSCRGGIYPDNGRQLKLSVRYDF